MAVPELLPLIEAVGRVLLGKDHQVRLAISCLLAGGHLLIEDRPGMGKSTLAEALARVFALAFKRVSFTSDLLPAVVEHRLDAGCPALHGAPHSEALVQAVPALR